MGSLYAVCDIVGKVLLQLSSFWSSVHGLDIKFDFVYAAERRPGKQEFLRVQSQPQCMLTQPMLWGTLQGISCQTRNCRRIGLSA